MNLASEYCLQFFKEFSQNAYWIPIPDWKGSKIETDSEKTKIPSEW